MNQNITYYDNETIKYYFKEVKHNPLISCDEEYELAVRAKNGDQSAIDALVNANLRFVIKIAKSYQGLGLSLNDLINEGNYGLIKAVHKFNPDRRLRFISYAVWWVRQSILYSINENGRVVKLPQGSNSKLAANRSDALKFEMEHGVQPVMGDIINEFGETHDPYIDTYKVYLNDVLSDDGDSDERISLLESDPIIEPFDNESSDIVKKELDKMLKCLDERERDVIKCYFGFDIKGEDNMTLESIGVKYDLTKERIRQIKEKAILKLRHNSVNLLSIINQ